MTSDVNFEFMALKRAARVHLPSLGSLGFHLTPDTARCESCTTTYLLFVVLGRPAVVALAASATPRALAQLGAQVSSEHGSGHADLLLLSLDSPTQSL